MARKRNLLFKRAWDFTGLTVILLLERLRKPIDQKLLLFRKNQRLKLLRNYNYAASSHRKRNLVLSFLLCSCSSANANQTGEEEEEEEEEMLGAAKLLFAAAVAEDGGDAAVADGAEVLWIAVPNDDSETELLADEEDESVDERAERFIRRFYEEMKNNHGLQGSSCKELCF